MANVTPLSAEAEAKYERWQEELIRVQQSFESLGLLVLILTSSDPAWMKIKDAGAQNEFQVRLSSDEAERASLHIRRTGEAFVPGSPDDNFVVLDLDQLLQTSAAEVLGVLRQASRSRDGYLE
ncbi:MAG: hypothetical protein AB7J40_01875 [Candidatus Altimarinota bacterium]